jgi:hypothetical protein
MVHPEDYACRELPLGAGLLQLPTTCQDRREPVLSVAHGTRGQATCRAHPIRREFFASVQG